MISVCMATYNGGNYIVEQILSILSQIGEDDELVISDDSSSDMTIELIKSINDKRIILIENQKFKNHNFNFENALNYAKGDYVFLCDQDDIWLPNKVERMLHCLVDLAVDVVVSDCFLVDSNKQIIHPSFFDLGRRKKSGLLYNLYKNSFLGCCMAFNRKVLISALPFPKTTTSHDTWIGLVGEIIGTTHFLNEQLLLFRRHGKNFSSDNITGDTFLTGKSPYKFTAILYNRVVLSLTLFRRFFKIKFSD